MDRKTSILKMATFTSPTVVIPTQMVEVCDMNLQISILPMPQCALLEGFSFFSKLLRKVDTVRGKLETEELV